MDQLPCPAFGFFGGVSLVGGFRILNEILSLSGVIICSGAVCYCIWGQLSETDGKAEEEELGSYRRRQIEVTLLFTSILVVVFSISIVEYLIRANHLIGVGTVMPIGQLIPLLMGIFGPVSYTHLTLPTIYSV